MLRKFYGGAKMIEIHYVNDIIPNKWKKLHKTAAKLFKKF